ncbi:MAG: alpha-1,2-fucosyltransferase [Lachnospiraceae bacterium]|nr:alpha-1,2-fucosyltransferase [Lachnospiraceae bacterium]
MIIIRLQGGLGNQLFQYALYLQLEASGHTVKIDDVSGYAGDRLRRPVLEELFGIRYEKATEREIRKLRDSFMDPLHRVKRKLFGRRNREWREPDGAFYPEVLTMEDAYLDGFFQSERYFADGSVQKALRAACGPVFSGSEERELAARIAGDGDRSVSLHIRRGDYLQPGTAETHGGICTEAYYRRAVSLADDRIRDAVYYIFSDDPDYAAQFAAQQTAAGRFSVVCLRDTKGAARDLAELSLMAVCRHHILANSSFSWWGAWLGGSEEERLVIAPDKWFNNRADEAVYTEEMIRISGS